jgi:hypothetical protein
MNAGEERLRAMVISAAMAALALTLPVVFHAVGLGNKFLPMFLPLLLNGFLAPFGWAVATGFTVPVISALLTGMPPLYPPVALVMSFEGAILGGVSSALYGRGRRSLWLALACAVISGRLSAFALTWLLARFLSLPPAMASLALLVQGLPGVALQFAVVPIVVRQLSKRQGILFANEHPRQA